ncbi:MAG: hypothetical protein R3E79_55555 [Caldilineaceae bacterium]
MLASSHRAIQAADCTDHTDPGAEPQHAFQVIGEQIGRRAAGVTINATTRIEPTASKAPTAVIETLAMRP